MKISLPILFSSLASLSAAIAIPRGGSSEAVRLPDRNEFVIYYQDAQSALNEATVGLPTSPASPSRVIYTGETRKNTPLAAVTWASADPLNPEIRLYYITPSNALGELVYSGGKWGRGANIGFPTAPDAASLYASRQSNGGIILGYTNQNGGLSEAYYENSAWHTYVL